jgi:hypothetical protein
VDGSCWATDLRLSLVKGAACLQGDSVTSLSTLHEEDVTRSWEGSCLWPSGPGSRLGPSSALIPSLGHSPPRLAKGGPPAAALTELMSFLMASKSSSFGHKADLIEAATPCICVTGLVALSWNHRRL